MAPQRVSAATMEALMPSKSTEPPQAYPSRSWWRKVPFVSTKPRGWLTNATQPDLTPEATANPLSKLLFLWLNPLLTAGYARPLQLDDMFRLQDDRSAAALADSLDRAWERRVEAAKNSTSKRDWRLRRRTTPPQPSLFLSLNDVVWKTFWFGGILKLLSDVGAITSPLLLRAITDYIDESFSVRNDRSRAPGWGRGFGLAVGLFLVQLCVVFLNVHGFYRSFGTGINLRTAILHSVYRRALHISPRARAQDGLGTAKLVTLISADASRIDFACRFFHMGWTSLVQILICLGLLISEIGYSALPGFALVLLMSPVQASITKHLFSLRKRSMKWTDARVKAIKEVVTGMRLIKLMSWEAPYLDRIAHLRHEEMGYLRARLGWRAANTALAYAAPTIAAVISFITYVAVGNDLRAGSIFSALTLFNLLRTPLQFLPVAWNATADAYNASQRIAKVFQAERAPPNHPVDAKLPVAVAVDRASFTWEASGPTKEEKATAAKGDAGKKEGASSPASPSTLDDISLALPRGSLTAIVGPIGSGKSSLISALASEMRLTSGSVTLGGGVSLCTQSAWILSASVRSNILFGREFDQQRYDAVVRDCCLLPDFQQLPDGDETIVGEKGLSLSGGQRQRINIARAVYHDDDIVLLDDCLSALDAHVGEAVLQQVILGALSKKTRVLATHSLHLLRHCDHIVTLRNGRIAEQGGYQELMARGGDFAAFVERYGSVRKDVDEAKEDKADAVVEEDLTDSDASTRGDNDKADESSDDKDKEKDKKPAAGVMQAEERQLGSVQGSTYLSYLGAGNPRQLLPLFALAILCFQASTVVSPLWLMWWEQGRFGLSNGAYEGGFAGLGVAQAISLWSTGFVFAVFTSTTSANLHGRALHRVAHAPVSFFDTTPVGRIIHRFSKDVDIVDNEMGEALRLLIVTLASVVGSIVLIAYITPYFLAAVAVVAFLYLWTGSYYRMSGRELRRLNALLRSKVYEHFSESLAGIATIRAYDETGTFQQSNAERIDVENRAYWPSMAAQRWLSIRLDGFGTLLVLAVAMLTVGTRFNISPGATGAALSYMLTVQSVWSYVVRQSAEVENNMSGVERLVYYADNIEMEAPLSRPERDDKLSKAWPEKGGVTLDKVVASHRPGLPIVLKGVSLDVGAGEHLGICGRTGAGKSTLVSVLSRTIELVSGSIRIDGEDISELGLGRLRSSLSVIPQDPLLFSGSLRYNLDPLGLRTDAELHDVMRRACLLGEQRSPKASSDSDTIAASSSTPALSLDTEIEEEGKNLSVGQRSLVSMARALARKTKIVVLDEATASVDYATDAAIQRTVAQDMAHLTVITVAHRLATVIGYDRICVMEQGLVDELGSPLELWDRQGRFHAMCRSAGLRREDVVKAQEERRRFVGASTLTP